MKKTDRRVRRTRRLLSDACISLILEKGYSTVTVEEIAERADVGRTTFYMHYRDKDDLFVHSIGRLSEEIYEQILPLIFSEGGTIGQMPVLMIFQHAEANADLYRVILRGAGNGQGLQQLRQDLSRYVQRVLEAEVVQQDLTPSVPVEVISRSFVGSLLGLVQWWLEQGCPHQAEDMTRMLRQLFNLGRLQVMGLTRPDLEPAQGAPRPGQPPA